ncbi:hypothetical protein JY651_07840 [Pyxidicoccus parkwayensis]|uniref:Uncharacterized protein n=1 Tax=Pyxidicoccus parkwayensis TaxID=2813578 RepID=A0ABX7P309_9BACT|nr:hypothetical protein [Pyxidicoccus parkwaysis]QSQ24841.1 hypothetical protein JY651_07840 [Pyxidicoccus parkwaysis]
MTSCARREDAAPTAAPDELPPGYVRLRSGQVVPEALAAHVLPAPQGVEASLRLRQERAGLATTAPACTCSRDELEGLLAALAEEREACIAAERAQAYAEGRAAGLRDALAEALAARGTGAAPTVHVPVEVAPAPSAKPVTENERDASHGSVTASVMQRDAVTLPVTLEGGRGEESAAARKRRLAALRAKKYRENQKNSAADDAREGVTLREAVTHHASRVTLPERDAGERDAAPAALSVHAPMSPVVRSARPAWMEEAPLGPEKLFFAWCQKERRRVFPQALPEQPPAGWGTWYIEALAAVGGDEERLRAAWRAYLGEDWARSRRPVCPARAFCAPEVWRRHVPGQDVPAEGALPSTPSSPAAARRRAALEVGRGEEPPRVACAAGCGRTSCTQVWGQPVCPACYGRLEDELKPPHWRGETVTAWILAQQARHAGAEPAEQLPGGAA